MIQAYKHADLYNKLVQQKATEAFEAQSIDAETYKQILEAHPSALYTPNFFIRIALGLLTAVAIFFFSLLAWLMSGAAHEYAFVALLIFLSVVCYGALELLIIQKSYYNAGVDNVLMCGSIVFIIAAFLTENYANNYIITNAVMVLFCFWLCLRFTDGFMAMLSFIALYILVLLVCAKAGVIGKAVAPFMLMLVSATVYLIAIALSKNSRLLFYHFSCKAVRLLALILFYGSANYFIVNEATKKMFSPDAHIPIILAVVYWTFTILIPVVYFIYGVRKKDLLFIRTGFVLFIATIFTVRYYHAFLPAEIDMLVAGVLLIAVSYVLIKYLYTPKHGFSFENTNRKRKDLLNVEAVIIAQVFGKSHVKQKGFDFGGGSSGGGGATGNY